MRRMALHRAGVETADGDDALEHVGLFARVGLVEHAFVTYARRARLVGVDARNQDDLVGNERGKRTKPAHVFAHRFLVVGRARPHDHEELIRYARPNIADIGIAARLERDQLVGKRIFRLQLLGRRQDLVHVHSHCMPPFKRRICPMARRSSYQSVRKRVEDAMTPAPSTISPS